MGAKKKGRAVLKIQPEDYYLNPDGLLVFTEHYHLRRGYCCGNGCRHCPYQGDKAKP